MSPLVCVVATVVVRFEVLLLTIRMLQKVSVPIQVLLALRGATVLMVEIVPGNTLLGSVALILFPL